MNDFFAGFLIGVLLFPAILGIPTLLKKLDRVKERWADIIHKIKS